MTEPPSVPSETAPPGLSATDLAAPEIAQSFLERWVRRGMLAGLGVTFAVPYFSLLNDIRVEGDEHLADLPRRNIVFLSNHQTYFMEAIAFFDLVYVRHQLPLEDPVLRFSAAEETMKKNLLTKLLNLAGGVTFRRSFRDAGVDVHRPVDLAGFERVKQAIRTGWLLHFPAGTTKSGAPLRSGVSRLLHDTKALAIPLRVDGFRGLLLHKQVPGKVLQACTMRIHPPLDLGSFYAAPYTKEGGLGVLRQLEALIGDPPDASAAEVE